MDLIAVSSYQLAKAVAPGNIRKATLRLEEVVTIETKVGQVLTIVRLSFVKSYSSN